MAVVDKVLLHQDANVEYCAEKAVRANVPENAYQRTSFESRLVSYHRLLKNKIEASCKTSIFGQAYLRRIDGFVTKFVTGRPRARQVIYGEDGWLFYNPDSDADPIGDYRGKIRYNEAVLQECRDGLVRISEWCKSNGIDFYVMIIPNKEVVYDELMPLSILRNSTMTRTDVLIEYLKASTPVKIIYPKENLRRAKSRCNVYYPRDTHWNLVGAYVGVQELLAEMGRPHCDFSTCEIVLRNIGHKGDLIKIGQLENEGYQDDDEIVVKGTPELEKRGLKWDDCWVNENKLATYNERLLIVGDSFRNAMFPSLAKEFRMVCSDHRKHSNDFKSHIDKIKPTILVLEFVERYSGSIGSTIISLIGE